MKVFYKKIELPFKYPFTISGGRTKTHQPSLIVALQLGPFTGYGEAPAINYYNISVEQMIHDLKQKKNFVEKFAFTEPERYWHYLHHLFPNNPFLVCALDMAAWDMTGKMRRKPLNHIWETAWQHAPLTNYTIGIDSPEIMAKKITDNLWPIYKIKLGTEDDIALLRFLRTYTDSTFRVDANAAWTLEEAQQKIPVMKDLGVELVEQPLQKDDWEGMRILKQQFQMLLFADESCVSENDVEKCSEHFHGINIKLTKCSGITPALRMIKKARELNLKVMMGCMNESSIGSAAIAQFLPQIDYVDMDGPLLLQEDIGSGLQYDMGKVIIGNHGGLGVQINEEMFFNDYI